MKLILFLTLTLLLFSCGARTDFLRTTLELTPTRETISELPPAASPLDRGELRQEWAKEALMGRAFGRELELYRAVTCFKRALFLLPKEEKERKQEIDYAIALATFLAGQHEELLEWIDGTERTSPFFEELTILAHEAALCCKEERRALAALEEMRQCSPDRAKELIAFRALREGDLAKLDEIDERDSVHRLSSLLASYEKERKSPYSASLLNALCPGLGYLYLGQRQSALTAFFLNALFIGAAYEFFRHGLIAPAIITVSFEMGWYFGGILGAKEGAYLYNKKLYSSLAHPCLCSERLYPLLQLRYGF